MTEKRQGPINDADSALIEQMVCGQIEQTYDVYRMQKFWARLFAGDNDPKAMAAGMCRALSGGHYVRKEAAGVCNISIQVFGEVNPEGIARELGQAMGRASTASHTA
ncbi:hypothetical protein [Pseudomonas tussilaginis]|uniref:hypothetical protein n=1 Tax=Pseudomonas sp. 5 TaxID=1619949 RepID=UPI0005EB97C2|nr:hypothetical protein [Pseudomonas sp. 5]KJK05311.1 hypothetical protein UB47_22115 [Pseudomonas sp. 5]